MCVQLAFFVLAPLAEAAGHLAMAGHFGYDEQD